MAAIRTFVTALLVILICQFETVTAQHNVALLCHATCVLDDYLEPSSFVGQLYKGAHDAAAPSGNAVVLADLVPGNVSAYSALGKFLKQNLVKHVVIHIEHSEDVGALASSMPELYFTLIDPIGATPDLPNVQFIYFREDQSGYLAGVLAGLHTKTGRVACIAGPSFNALFKFRFGFEMGVRHVCSTCIVDGFFAGNFVDTVEGTRLARMLVDRGADVLFGAAGVLGSAAILSVANNTWVIGVDVDEYTSTFHTASDQQKEHLLGSAIKSADVAVFISIREAMEKRFTKGMKLLDIAVGGVRLSDCHASCRYLDERTRSTLRLVVDDFNSSVSSISTGIDATSGIMTPTYNASQFVDLSDHFGDAVLFDVAPPKVALLGYRLFMLTSLSDSLYFYNTPGNSIDSLPPPTLRPSERTDYVFVTLGMDGILHGGKETSGNVVSDLWRLEMPCLYGKPLCGTDAQWTLIQPTPGTTVPTPRYWHAAATFNNTALLIFGGFNSYSQALQDLWQYNVMTSKWELLTSGTGPVGRGRHAATLWTTTIPHTMNGVTDSNWFVIFGGRSISPLNDMWMFSLKEKSWVEIVPRTIKPQPRFDTCFIALPETFFVVKGASNQGLLDSSWTYSVMHNTWTEFTTPPLMRSGTWVCTSQLSTSTESITVAGQTPSMFHKMFFVAQGRTSSRAFFMRTFPSFTCNTTENLVTMLDGQGCTTCGQDFFASPIGGGMCVPCSSPDDSRYCPRRFSETNIGLIVGVVIAGIFVLTLPFIWKFTENHRRMAKLLNNDKVATELAESVALMNFEQVEYLQDIKHPTRIQRAFLLIVDTLKRYKNYMPPSLLVAGDDVDTLSISDESTDAGGTMLYVNGSNDAATNPSVPSKAGGARNSSLTIGPQRAQHALRDVTVLGVSIISFNIRNTLVEIERPEFVKRHAAAWDVIVKSVNKHKGLPVVYYADYVLVAFNALTRCTARAYHAAGAMYDVSVGTSSNPGGLQLSMGASMGQAFCGDFGSSGMQMFAVVGLCVNEAIQMQSMHEEELRRSQRAATDLTENHHQHTECHGMISGKMYIDCAADFKLRVSTFVKCLKHRDDNDIQHRYVPVIEVLDMMHGGGLDSIRDNHDSEWMYSLEGNSLLNDYNEAALAMIRGVDDTHGEFFLEKHKAHASFGTLESKMKSLMSQIAGAVEDVTEL